LKTFKSTKLHRIVGKLPPQTRRVRRRREERERKREVRERMRAIRDGC